MPVLLTRTALVVVALLAGCDGEGSRPSEPTDPGTDPSTPPTEATAPAVLSVSPGPDASEVPPEGVVVIVFSEPVDPESGVATLEAGAVPCVEVWDPTGAELTLVPAQPFGSMVTYDLEVSGYADVADGLAMPPFASSFTSALREVVEPRPKSGTGGPWRFTEQALAAGLVHPFEYDDVEPIRTAAGGAAGDYDGDGFVDFYVGRGDLGTTHLYRNRGDGTFEDTAAAAGVLVDDAMILAPSFVDHDGDRDLDLLLLNYGSGVSRFYRNEGDGTFVDVLASTLIENEDFPAFSVIWGDYDLDFDLDLFVARFVVPGTDPRFLYVNNGDGTFSDGSLLAQLFQVDIQQSFTPNFADMDDDGYPELLVASDHGLSVYLRNDADGTFSVDRDVELTDENGMGATIADYDNDGDLDWFVTAIYDPNGVSENIWGVYGNRLYQNQGDGSIVDVSEAAGVRDGGWGWGACAQDFDLDGNIDLYNVNGWVETMDIAVEEYKDRSKLFRNEGDGTFAEIGLDLGITDTAQGRGVTCADYDRDGDVDVFTTNYRERPLLYRNDGNGLGHFLNVRLEGRPPNTEGVGARVYLTIGGTTQMRELKLGANYGSNDPVEAHFGTGDAQIVDELRVVWPDGSENVGRNVVCDRFVAVTQP